MPRAGSTRGAPASACYDAAVTSRAPTVFTATEYLALERASDRRHEFVDGRILAMAGARPPHNMLTVGIAAALRTTTRRHGCATMSSDQRVHVPATGLYTYPDVVVACGDRRYDGEEPPSLLNPTVLVEVTSDSTEDFDRGQKFLHYQSIRELQDYIIVSHRESRIDHYRRDGDGRWKLTTHLAKAARVRLSGVVATISLADIYDGVDLAEGLAAPPRERAARSKQSAAKQPSAKPRSRRKG